MTITGVVQLVILQSRMSGLFAFMCLLCFPAHPVSVFSVCMPVTAVNGDTKDIHRHVCIEREPTYRYMYLGWKGWGYHPPAGDLIED